MVDSSISSLALYGKQQFADHFGKNFRFDIQTFFEEQSDFSRHSLPSAPDPVTTGSIETKSKLYLDRFFTYAENYALLQSESALFDRFLSVYGERLTRRFFEWHSRNEVDKAFEKAASLLIVK